MAVAESTEASSRVWYLIEEGQGLRVGRARSAGATSIPLEAGFYVEPEAAAPLIRAVERALSEGADPDRYEESDAPLGRGRSPSGDAGPRRLGLVTGDPRMIQLCRDTERLAPSDATVLLLGESGTGKELFAKALHGLNRVRSAAPLEAINCAAIPSELLESELFGFERGAFTGAYRARVGRIERANGGTLFLDEIGELPLEVQAKLLRFLQQRTVQRLGGRREIPVDVRVVCATNRDLVERMGEGAFRDDFYYRVAEVQLRLPPLRERPGDPALIAHALLKGMVRQHKARARKLGSDALAVIAAYRWPGNVRELENALRRAVILSEGGAIRAEDLGLPLPRSLTVQRDLPRLREVRDEAERRVVAEALGRCNGNISRAATELGVTRPTIYELLAKHGMR
ncbi:sigma 54-interacting transcriptional regulator [Halorhodospira halophila]|uniref:Sigma54 specific transcriptional regulator, Fis family n=1 Tax=Halorhodospira halophila (strain DSM 244 / SL1) TaxID=349124 RepID=A1WXC9_HALHL|nr:sigma 54-interacting transcriptional regulator [Halorhodospira halophila]ABM62341.1 sigma54 specific transcriptional regulator, Fis family [Halorhodospira halophila SL1]MBK1730058.1 sigma-54-dependent Fis family transcriptional regulator [Halorhodospira halophila]